MSYPRWLLPSGELTSALIRLSLRLDTRIINHTPWKDAKNDGYLTPERGRAMAVNAAKARAAKRAQQIALLPFDEGMQR